MFTEGSKAIYCLGETEENIDIDIFKHPIQNFFVKPLLKLSETKPRYLFDVKLIELYKEIDNLESQVNILLKNQTLMLNQLHSLQETVKKCDEEQKIIHELELKESQKLFIKEIPKDIENPFDYLC